MRRRSQRTGFTLLELITVVALLAVVSAMVMSALLLFIRTHSTAVASQAVQTASRRALSAMAADVREAGAASVDAGGALVLTRLAPASTVRYAVEGAQLKRFCGSECRVIAGGIESLQVQCLDAGGLPVAGGGKARRVRTDVKVTMRSARQTATDTFSVVTALRSPES